MNSCVMTEEAVPRDSSSQDAVLGGRIHKSVHRLESWMHARDYAGYEPFDLMNSPYIGAWARRFPFSILIRQFGRRLAGLRTRRLLRVPASKNCKALGLTLSGYCDLARCGEDWQKEAIHIKSELCRLRSPNVSEFSWGYDWDAISLRAGNKMPAFSPNAVATTFCASALLDMADVFGDREALDMAASAGRFLINQLNRPVNTETELCFSYTPRDQTRIYNASALVSGLLVELGARSGNHEYLNMARRGMRYIVNEQLPDGAWYYGAEPRQKWIDSFHTAYNLDSLLQFQRATGESLTAHAVRLGYEYYKRTFFYGNAPSYYHNRLHPIDIHSCSQAILTFCNFSPDDKAATSRALDVTTWTLQNMLGEDGAFYYQRHRLWTNRTPYMRWGQAWMFRALARLQREIVAPNDSSSALGQPYTREER